MIAQDRLAWLKIAPNMFTGRSDDDTGDDVDDADGDEDDDDDGE